MDKHKEISEMKITDNFEKFGWWKLPQYENSICGKIVYNNDGIQLQIGIHAKGKDVTSDFLQQRKQFPQNIKIDGVLETGENVLLNRCYKDQYACSISNSNAVIQDGYMATEMFVGKDLSSHDLMFDGISISYTSMYTWLRPDTINLQPSDSMEKNTITHTVPEYPKIVLDTKLSLQIGYGYSTPSASMKIFTIPQNVSVILYSKEKLPLSELQQKIDCFRSFLMFATGTAVQGTAKRVLSGNDHIPVFSSHRVYEDIVDEFSFYKMNFPYPAIKDQFEDVIRDWFEFYAEYEKSLDLYFRTKLEHRHLTYEIKFLRIMQSLEVFHKIKFPEENVHLKSCIARLREITDDLLSSSTYPDNFDADVTDIRNYIAHGFLESSKVDRLSGQTRLVLMHRLDLLMFACMLKETKIPDRLKATIITKKLDAIGEIKTLE